TILLQSALPDITNPVAINGPGVTVRRDLSAARFSVIRLGGSPHNTWLTGLTITGGLSDDNGGGVAILVGQTVTVEGSAITGNSATGGGGGIYAVAGTNLTVRNCTISGNSASSTGTGG